MHILVCEKGWQRRIFKFIANIRTPLAHSYQKWEIKNYWLRLAGLNISNKGVSIEQGFQCLTGQEENIFIDDYSAIGIGVKFWNFNEIRLGKFCMLAADVTLTNGGHDINTFEPFSGPLTIGSGCWIGTGARIIGPLIVGDNAIIAAGAIVIKDVPPGSIVGGVPAKVIGMRNLPSKVWHLGDRYFCPKTFEVIN